MKKNKTTIGIIGLGKFGTLTSAILEKDFDVKIYHYKDTEEKRALAKKLGAEFVDFETICQSDIIIITVPISKTEAMIKEIGKKVKKGALVMDACSVKVYPCRWLQKYIPENVEIMGTHPMFGPVTSKFDLEKKDWKIDDKQVVLCPLRIAKEKFDCIKKYLEKLGIEVIETTPEDHDKQNAKTLSLVHFVGRSLVKAGVGEQKIYTPGYADLLKIIPHTNDDKWQLFCDMNNFNPYAKSVIRKFTLAGEELEADILENITEDKDQFKAEMVKIIDEEILRLKNKRDEFI